MAAGPGIQPPFEAAVRLIWLACHSDDFDGWATANHLNIAKMPLRKALNVVWYYLSKEGTKKGIEKLKADLIKPLPGMTEEVSEAVVQGELAMFQRAMSSNKGSKKK